MGQKLPKVRTIVLMSDRRQSAAKDIKAVGEYEDLLASMSAEYDFPDLDENTQATTFYTTGTTGVPKGVYFSHRQIVLRHPGGTRHLWICVATRWARPPRRLYADDPHVPRPCLGSTVVSTAAGLKQVYPGRYAADFLVKLIKAEGVTFTHGVPTLLEDATGGVGTCSITTGSRVASAPCRSASWRAAARGNRTPLSRASSRPPASREPQGRRGRQARRRIRRSSRRASINILLRQFL